MIFFNSDENTKTKTTYIDLSTSRVDAIFEGGLLGMAFHPNFARNGYVYLSYTTSDDPVNDKGVNFRSHVSRFTVNGDRTFLDPDSEVVILSVAQPWDNHNGGNIIFGPDGYLYTGFGDGGSWGDPKDNGQNTHTFLGSYAAD